MSREKVAGESTGFWNDSFKIYKAALDTMRRNNATFEQKIIEGNCEKSKYFVLKAAFEAAMLENEALQNGQLCTENMIKQDGKPERAVQRFEKDDASSRSQKGNLQELHQGLRPNLTIREALEERRVELTDEKNFICEDTYATVKECFELWKDKRYLDTVAEENRNLEMEMETLRAYKVNFVEQLKSELPQEDIEDCHVRLESENHCLRRENEEMHESCTELQKKVKYQEMVQEECRRFEEEKETLRGQNSRLKEATEELKSKLPQEDVEKRRGLLKSENHRLRRENEEMHESCTKIQKKVKHQEMVQEECRRFEEEKETLRGQNRRLKEEIEELKSKLPQEDVEKRRGLLKSEIYCISLENGKIRDSCAELRERVAYQEMIQEECKPLEEEIEGLRVQAGYLKEAFEQQKQQLPPEDMGERYVQLQTERDRKCEEIQLLQNDISNMIQKLADESCSKMKSEAIELSRNAFEKEYTALNDYLKTITKSYNDIKAKDSKYKGKIRKMESLKSKNEREQQEIDKLQEELLNLKAMSERYKHIDKEEAEIEAINKKLLEKKQKLEKELKMLKVPEEATDKAKCLISELKKENCSLYAETLKLKDYLEQKKLIKVHLELLKSEEKTLTQRNSDLKKEISALEKVEKTGLVKWYVAENQIYQDRIKRFQHRNDELQSFYNDLYVKMYTQQVQKIYNNLNDDTKTDISQHRRHLKDQIGQLLDAGGAGDPPMEGFPPGTPVSPST